MTTEVYHTICEGDDCQGCKSCPEWNPYQTIEDAIAEVEDFHAMQLENLYASKAFGYSRRLIERLVYGTPETEAEDDGEPKAYESHVRDVKVRGNGAKLTALLQRDDGSTIFYANKLNAMYGEPGTGKSWVALIAAYETILMGGRVMWWDFEDDPDTLARRAQSLGILEYVQDKSSFRFCDSSLEEPTETIARQQISDWLTEVDNSLVIIDAAESSGCPSDGKDVAPWFRKMVHPWITAGAGVLFLDHVPKSRIDRPLGPIGSGHKRAVVSGASVYVTGSPWNKEVGGGIKLVNHKDRNGDLPAGIGKQIALITGQHVDGVLRYAITAPKGDDQEPPDDLKYELLARIVDTGFDGVKGSMEIRKLVKGKGQDIDKALNELVANGLVDYKMVGQAKNYAATQAGKDISEEYHV